MISARIITASAHPRDAKILVGDEDLAGITKSMQISLKPTDVTTAVAELMVDKLDVRCKLVFGIETLEFLAKYHGYELVKKP